MGSEERVFHGKPGGQVTKTTLYVFHLKLPTEIRLGHRLKFECETSSVIPATKSRQWRGGANNKLLCYDGTTVDPTKYKEKIINQTNYELIVEEASENDLQCLYACRVGFDIDQKFLEVNEYNFVQLPDENFTKVDYQMQNGQSRLILVLFKVFPKPVCKLKNKTHSFSRKTKQIFHKKEKVETKMVIEMKLMVPIRGATVDTICGKHFPVDIKKGRVLPETNATKSVVLYNVTYRLESSESIIPCGEQLEIECKVGNERYLVPARNSIICNSSKTSKDSATSLVTSVGVCVACISFVGLAVLWTICKRKKKDNCEYTRAVNKAEGMNLTI
ncbi:unnamed protein product [Mytilus coruscus]|uniref:Ig-like domain-containing protein n=1 Tax=Mytilus coruscus TaxID=42192 RepID=A0A6J8DUV1_MYTCO|nr:unnamed protein product [Mytilus coruscus]